MADTPGFHQALRRGAAPGPIGCVGLDPSSALLAQWGLPDDAEGALAFCRALIAAADGLVPVVKPQVGYFERFGPEGYRVLARVIAEARERGLLVIADAKRGDIGPTCDAYADAWLGAAAPLRVDALTVAPWLGFGTLLPFFERAAGHGGYVFVVVRSSNPEGAALQKAGTPPAWHGLLDAIAGWSSRHGPHTVGAVIGATAPQALAHGLGVLPEALFLAPGIGRQGARTGDLAAAGLALDRVIASASRAVAEAGPEPARLRAAVAAVAAVAAATAATS